MKKIILVLFLLIICGAVINATSGGAGTGAGAAQERETLKHILEQYFDEEPKEWKKAYRKLCLKYHPDKAIKKTPEEEVRLTNLFQQINDLHTKVVGMPSVDGGASMQEQSFTLEQILAFAFPKTQEPIRRGSSAVRPEKKFTVAPGRSGVRFITETLLKNPDDRDAKKYLEVAAQVEKNPLYRCSPFGLCYMFNKFTTDSVTMSDVLDVVLPLFVLYDLSSKNMIFELNLLRDYLKSPVFAKSVVGIDEFYASLDSGLLPGLIFARINLSGRGSKDGFINSIWKAVNKKRTFIMPGSKVDHYASNVIEGFAETICADSYMGKKFDFSKFIKRINMLCKSLNNINSDERSPGNFTQSQLFAKLFLKSSSDKIGIFERILESVESVRPRDWQSISMIIDKMLKASSQTPGYDCPAHIMNSIALILNKITDPVKKHAVAKQAMAYLSKEDISTFADFRAEFSLNALTQGKNALVALQERKKAIAALCDAISTVPDLSARVEAYRKTVEAILPIPDNVKTYDGLAALYASVSRGGQYLEHKLFDDALSMACTDIKQADVIFKAANGEFSDGIKHALVNKVKVVSSLVSPESSRWDGISTELLPEAKKTDVTQRRAAVAGAKIDALDLAQVNKHKDFSAFVASLPSDTVSQQWQKILSDTRPALVERYAQLIAQANPEEIKASGIVQALNSLSTVADNTVASKLLDFKSSLGDKIITLLMDCYERPTNDSGSGTSLVDGKQAGWCKKDLTTLQNFLTSRDTLTVEQLTNLALRFDKYWNTIDKKREDGAYADEAALARFLSTQPDLLSKPDDFLSQLMAKAFAAFKKNDATVNPVSLLAIYHKNRYGDLGVSCLKKEWGRLDYETKIKILQLPPRPMGVDTWRNTVFTDAYILPLLFNAETVSRINKNAGSIDLYNKIASVINTHQSPERTSVIVKFTPKKDAKKDGEGDRKDEDVVEGEDGDDDASDASSVDSHLSSDPTPPAPVQPPVPVVLPAVVTVPVATDRSSSDVIVVKDQDSESAPVVESGEPKVEQQSVGAAVLGGAALASAIGVALTALIVKRKISALVAKRAQLILSNMSTDALDEKIERYNAAFANILGTVGLLSASVGGGVSYWRAKRLRA